MTTPEDIELSANALETFYSGYFRYYNTLNGKDKELFVSRCLQFISEKKIAGSEGFVPDNRVKALVAASAVQLTLGLETWKLDYFEEIELYPSEFKNAQGNLSYYGETNLQGYIRLSWKNFINGYSVADDNVNLGLHEFSHALRFNSFRGNAQDYFVDHYFDKWMMCANTAFSATKQGKSTLFRKYGGTNINEFLSVCIEHYFESPDEIKAQEPLLYYATGILLNQCTSASSTRIGVRKEFFAEQNQLFQGFEKYELRSSFQKHWTFKLWLFVCALLVYNLSGGHTSISLGLGIMVICVYLWYDYNATQFIFEGKEIHLRKGAFLFRRARATILLLSELVSVRMEGKEWQFIYYTAGDAFFNQRAVHPPNGVKEAFTTSCIQNKIAVFK